MKLTLLYSIYNRNTLFSRGLETIAKQSMKPEDFEVLIVDCQSTEDISQVYAPYIGKWNIRHLTWNRRLHPIWREMNPDPSKPENWYHTQAISANIGISEAKGEIVCLSQPEMLHGPRNLELGFRWASEYKQAFCEIHWGTQLFNQWLDSDPTWRDYPYDALWECAEKCGAEYTASQLSNGDREVYWYIEFFPKAAAEMIGGVDLRYQSGVYAEDDQFRLRMELAGCKTFWAGRNHNGDTSQRKVMGIHQSHMDEKGKITWQDRTSNHWNKGAEHNRALFAEWKCNPYMVANEGLDYDWRGQFCVTDRKEYLL